MTAAWYAYKRRTPHLATVLGLSWFGLGLLPFLFLPDRSYAYYISLASIGLYLALTAALVSLLDRISPRKKITALACLVTIYTLIGLTRMSLELDRNWISLSARSTKRLHTEIKARYPTLPETTTLILGPSFNAGPDPSLYGIRVLYGLTSLNIVSPERGLEWSKPGGLEIVFRLKPGFDPENTFVFVYTGRFYESTHAKTFYQSLTDE